MPDLFAEVEIQNVPKAGQVVSGDVAAVYRRPEATFVFLADGLKSGVRANLAAEFCLARLRCKLECGASLTEALSDVLLTLEDNRRRLSLWTALSVLHIVPRGLATIYSYEMPPPLVLMRRGLHLVPPEHVTLGGAILSKYRFELSENEGVVLVSDGITQAGIGHGLAWGWGIEGIRREGEFFLASNAWWRLPGFLVQRAQDLSCSDQSDDATAALVLIRKARQVVVFTGPPGNPERDEDVVQRFLAFDGCKIVCGGTTAGIVARILKTEAIVDPKSLHPFCPPRLLLDGVDYATEGAISLNQLYNLLHVMPKTIEERNVVVDLYEKLIQADQIRFLVGKAENPASAGQSFYQTGILPRQHIVPILAEKLRSLGKLVTVEWV